MDGSSASLFNLRGGLSIKYKIALGGYFSTSINEINPESETVQGVYMDYWTIGGLSECTLRSKKLVHLTFPLYVGIGEVEMDNENDDTGLGEANFFQIEPSALLEVNVHKYVRFNIDKISIHPIATDTPRPPSQPHTPVPKSPAEPHYPSSTPDSYD